MCPPPRAGHRGEARTRMVGSRRVSLCHANLGPGRRPAAGREWAAAASARHLHRADPGRPRPGPTATMYVCGITPYDATHLGHAATYLAFDLVNRVLAGSGARRALRPERHRHRRPAAGARRPRPRRLGRARHAGDGAVPRGHGGAAGAAAAALHRRGRGDGGDLRAGRQAARAGRGLPRRRPGVPRRLLRLLGHRSVRLRVQLRRGHDAGLLPGARRRPRPSGQARAARPAAVADGAGGRAVVGVRPRRRAGRAGTWSAPRSR